MPKEGSEYRSQQIADISQLTHDWLTGEEYQTLIQEAEKSISSLDPSQRSRWQREFAILAEERDKAKKLPSEFVAEFAQETNKAHGVWAEARKNAKFSDFASTLEKIVSLSKRQADYIGYTSTAYDALLDGYEKGAKTEEIAKLFDRLKKDLIPIVASAKSFPSPLSKPIPAALQESFCKDLPSLLGLSRGESRLDTSHHPFSTSLGKYDKRITTRYSESDPLSSIFGVLHETGHSLYEAGLSRIEDWPNPIAEFCSLGMHESQSRLWENQVGRSRSFWEFIYPKVMNDFQLNENEITFQSLYQYINSTQKSKIRVEADQVTYNLHIILRFEIESDLINEKIKVKDLPEIWNSKIKEYLGLKIENDAEGVLQDIHWSMGAFGYFPTYTLGNIFSAQLFSKFESENPDYNEAFSKRGDFSSLLDWLRKKIHLRGKELDAQDLIKEATGELPDAKHLIQYLKTKVAEVG